MVGSGDRTAAHDAVVRGGMSCAERSLLGRDDVAHKRGVGLELGCGIYEPRRAVGRGWHYRLFMFSSLWRVSMICISCDLVNLVFLRMPDNFS